MDDYTHDAIYNIAKMFSQISAEKTGKRYFSIWKEITPAQLLSERAFKVWEKRKKAGIVSRKQLDKFEIVDTIINRFGNDVFNYGLIDEKHGVIS